MAFDIGQRDSGVETVRVLGAVRFSAAHAITWLTPRGSRSALSPVPVGVFAMVSLGLAALVWRRPDRSVIAGIVLVAAAGVLDVVEIIHQVGLSRARLATPAVLVAVLHLGVIAGGARLWVTAGADTTGGGRGAPPAPTPADAVGPAPATPT